MEVTHSLTPQAAALKVGMTNIAYSCKFGTKVQRAKYTLLSMF